MEALFFYLMSMYTAICSFTPESTEPVPDSLQYLCFTKAEKQYIEDNLDYALKISNKECKKRIKEYLDICNQQELFVDWNKERIASCSQKEISDYILLETRCGFKFENTYLSANKSLYEAVKYAIETKGNGHYGNSYNELYNYYYNKYEKVCNVFAKEKFNIKYGKFIIPTEIKTSSEICKIDPMNY